jgi:hypothetical protein
MAFSGIVWVIMGSISILPSMYQSTILGTSVRPRAPLKAVPRHTRPVTSWNGRVAISCPAPATPMMMLWPQPRWQHSDEVASDFGRIDEMRHAEAFTPSFFSGFGSTPMIMSAPTSRKP